MEDQQIVDLYWARDERAIQETADKYGRYCGAIAYNILHNREDSEECVASAYWRAWKAIPPQRPSLLGVFLGKIVRRLSLDAYRRRGAAKRGGGQLPLALEELEECVPAAGGPQEAVEDRELVELLNRFLAGLPEEGRRIFLGRYWYLRPVREMARELGLGESKVKMSLLRSRQRLRALLEEEGISL